MKTPEEIKDIAFEWSVDYTPFEQDLHYSEYARHGYEQGYVRAQKEMQSQLQQMHNTIKSLCGAG